MRFALPICSLLLANGVAHAAMSGFGCEEDFSDVNVLRQRGWMIHTSSQPMGSRSWRQGDPHVFSAWSGGADSFAMVGAETLAARDERVSEWLITPEFDFDPFISARQLSFHTRASPGAGNRLVVRMCVPSGSNRCDAPSGDADDIGNFSSQLLDIDGTSAPGGYPLTWTPYFTDDLPIEGRARFALQYRPRIQNGMHGSTVGVDSFAVAGVSTCPFEDNVFIDGFDQ